MHRSFRVVIDTNVLVSAVLAPDSVPGQAMFKAEASGYLLGSADTVAELAEVLFRVKFSRLLTIESRLEFLKKYQEGVQFVSIPAPIRACRDPRDDKFLELAVYGSADVIVTGDGDLLTLNPFQGIRILSPLEYLNF